MRFRFYGLKYGFDKTSMKGVKIRHSLWNDAYIAASRFEI
jgi:hypothetical protein